VGTRLPRPGRLAAAVLGGGLFAVAGLAQAHALGPGPAGAVDARFVLGGSGSHAISGVDLTLERTARRVSIKLDSGGWIACRTEGVHAFCPLARAWVPAAALTRLDVVASG
jgi:hypothetical protein